VGGVGRAVTAENVAVIRARTLRLLAGAALSGLFMLLLAPAGWGASPTTAAATPTRLFGSGAWAPSFGEIVTWQNDLSSSKSPIIVNYAPHGTVLGRQDFLAGTSDFVLSGVPFQSDELAQAKKTTSDIIDAPVAVASLGVILTPPFPNGFVVFKQICDPDDPTTWPPGFTDPDQCLSRTPLTAPLRIPKRNLGAMVLAYQGHDVLHPLNSWNNADVLASLGVSPPGTLTTGNAGPAPVLRSDPDEATKYLLEYIAGTAPDVWTDLKADHPTVNFEPITERMARLNGTATRDGAHEQANQVTIGLGADPNSGGINQFTAGVLGPLPPSAFGYLRTFTPKAQIEFLQMQNANGDWVVPTPDSITKAVAAGGDTPLYAMSNKVAGAYPLAWVDHLYAPAHGLSQAKTEALATTIRYLATAGQDAAAPVGEGRLSAPLAQQALAAANHVVESNCTQPRMEIVSSTDPGPMAPATLTSQHLPAMKHCVATAPPATSSTTAPPTTGPNPPGGAANLGGGTGSFGSSDNATASGLATSPSGAASGGGGATSSGTASGGSSNPATAGGRGANNNSGASNALLTASHLTVPPPGSVPPADRVATFLLGVGLFLLLRKPAMAFARRAFG
jgi:hypothetical protein